MSENFREAARSYAEAVWRDNILDDEATREERAYKLKKLEAALEDEFPMPENKKEY